MLLPQVLEEGRKPTSLFTYKVNFEHIENFFLKRVRVGEWRNLYNSNGNNDDDNNEHQLTKKRGGTGSWTQGLSDCSRLLYHWAIPPSVFSALTIWKSSHLVN